MSNIITKIVRDEIWILKRKVLIEKSYYLKQGDIVRIDTKHIEPYHYWNEFKNSLGTVHFLDKEWSEVMVIWFTMDDRIGLPSTWDAYNLIRVEKKWI